MDHKNFKYGQLSRSVSFNFGKAKTKFNLNLDYNGKNSYLLVNRKKRCRFKADNINVYFPTELGLRSISEKFYSNYASETSDYWY